MSYEAQFWYTFPSGRLNKSLRPADYESIEPVWNFEDMNDSSATGSHYFKTLEGFVGYWVRNFHPEDGGSSTREYGIQLRDKAEVREFESLKANATSKAIDRYLAMREEFEKKYPSAERLAAKFKRQR